jgi:ketosteroid isomerase-like protein
MKKLIMKKLMMLGAFGACLLGANIATAQTNPQEEKAVMAVLTEATQALVKKDFAAIKKHYHEDLSYGHASGRLQTKQELLDDVANPMRIWESWKLTHPTVKIYGNTAVVRCISDIVNGPPGKADLSHTRYLWVLLKGPTGWQILAGQRVSIPLTETS